ncbi:hypothetical protein SDC9_174190 [bioreactor metagenome]|uniref:SpoVT-AbrB domain-containing protein n=1 Tax=bioreactor metagenome TaxID=1076179 RepID=A0A645GJ79_9ZZZZ
MTRKVDELGRVVIPPSIRDALGLKSNSEVNIDCVEGKIILTSTKPCCAICRSMEHKLFSVNKTFVCVECLNQIKKF